MLGRLLAEEREAERVEPGAERLAVEAVAGEPGFEPLLPDGAQGLAQPVHHRGRRRVMVEAGRAPVLGDLAEVEVVTPDWAKPRRDHGLGAGVVGERREPGGTAQALLGPRDGDVDVPAVDGDLAAAQGHHAVGDEERSVGVGDARDLLEGLQHARRRLAVDHGHQLGASAGDRGRDRLGLDDPAPLAAHGDDLGPAALGDLDQEPAEAPALAHHHPVPRLDERDEGGLEPGPPRARDRERPRVRRLEHEARQLRDLAHDRGELGIELAEQRRGHRPQDARIGHRRAGPEQDARQGQHVADGRHGRGDYNGASIVPPFKTNEELTDREYALNQIDDFEQAGADRQIAHGRRGRGGL